MASPETSTPVDGGELRIRRPRSTSAPFTSARDVARAYNYPLDSADGSGLTVGIIELGGAVGGSDLRTYLMDRGLEVPTVVSVNVAGGRPVSDGASGADGEVMLDVEVVAAIAPKAALRVYFAPNTDEGFRQAVVAATSDGVDCISISWGGPENAWSRASVTAMDLAIAAARAAGIPTFVAAGDSGSQDSGGDGRDHVDFPASSPNAVGCGGTRLTVHADGSRDSEVVWDDNDRSSATGGGSSVLFPGRNVPDVAGNADPVTGYEVRVDGQEAAIGGTSAVAPLYAGLYVLIKQLIGRSWDPLTVIPANPTVCFDVTSGDNGTFRAGPGRDATTGFGVVDGAKLLAALAPVTGTVPAQPTGPDPITPTPVPAPAPGVDGAALIRAFWTPDVRHWALEERHTGDNRKAAAAVAALAKAAGLA
jgi:kumamolisin